MRVPQGTRIGIWHPTPPPFCPPMDRWKNAFQSLGRYVGPDLGDTIIGQKFKQQLMEGELMFSVGVLFRPDRGKHEKLEPILILQTYFPEMFDYDTWEKTELSANSI